MDASQSNPVFEFTDIEDIYPALLNLRCPALPIDATITNDHLGLLEELAQTLQAGEQALDNARELGTGYGDFAVILIEPSDKADTHCFDEMFASSTALKAVDVSLRHAFAGQRDIHNTIILDIRAFRSDAIRQKERNVDRRAADDERAYTAFKDILNRLKPDVILVCQCQTNTEDVKNDFARGVCSSIKEATDISVLHLDGSSEHHDAVMVKSFHPMYLKYQREAPDDTPTKAVMREYLFDASFVVAANALEGRRVSGVGLYNLNRCLRDGAVFIPTSQGIEISYQWSGESDIPDPELVRGLEELGLWSEDEDERELREILLAKFKTRNEGGSTFVSDNHRGKAYQKDDILGRLGPIRKLPQGTIRL
ncbi:hypothetical protein BJY00DRAFT_294776 [Aspergillus carlsbadensis]|nr:hypothetical protein BJY00DRAFT_294776 [Aspergillus carlsbadensis]